MSDAVHGSGRLTLDLPEKVETEHRRAIYRHPFVIRATHWINAVCFILLLMSGLQIFNAHPALYWGQRSDFDHPWLAMSARDTASGEPEGITSLGSHSLTTTGVLGLSYDAQGQAAERGFPSWLTIPSGQDLATGRRWHFLFAWILVLNGLAYLAYGIATRSLGSRVLPSRDQWRHIGAAVREHLTLHFAQGSEAKRYNIIQKLTYLLVIFVLLPVQILAGLAMSPGMDAVAHPLLAVFGGRQSARSIHFIVANLLVLFLVVHVVMVVVSGFWNNMRGMASGWFVIQRRVEHDRPQD